MSGFIDINKLFLRGMIKLKSLWAERRNLTRPDTWLFSYIIPTFQFNHSANFLILLIKRYLATISFGFSGSPDFRTT